MKTFWLSLFTSFSFFLVNILGFTDTFTDSKMGCGKTYPLCNGKLFPNFSDLHSVVEYNHRLFVFLSMVFLGISSFVAIRKYKTKLIKTLVLFAISGVVLESFLGAMSVFYPSSPYLMATHMGVALISFASLLNIAFVVRSYESGHQDVKVSQGFHKFSWVCLIFLYIAIYFGSFVASTGAGGSFNGLFIPTENFSSAGTFLIIDIGHRLFALGLVVLSMVTVVMARKEGSFKKLSITSLILVLSQALSGMLLVYSHLSLYAVLIHVSIISILFGVQSVITIQSNMKNKESISLSYGKSMA